MMIFQIFLSFIWAFVARAMNWGVPASIIASQVFIFGLPIAVYFIITKEPVLDTLSIRPISFINVLLVIMMAIFVQPFMSALSAVTSIFFPNAASDLFGETFSYSLPVLLGMIAILPAIFEEAFFRGVILSGYRKVGILKSCIITGLLFGLMHANLQQLLYASVMGIAFAFLVYVTRSIFASVIAHFTINASQVILSYSIMSRYGEKMFTQPQAPLNIGDIIMSLISIGLLCFITAPVLILLVWVFIKYNKVKNPPAPKFSGAPYRPARGSEESFFDIPFCLSILVYTIFVIVLPAALFVLSYMSAYRF